MTDHEVYKLECVCRAQLEIGCIPPFYCAFCGRLLDVQWRPMVPDSRITTGPKGEAVETR